MSDAATIFPRRRRRFCFLVFDVKMWRRLLFFILTFPFFVMLKRFAAPLFVFIFGIFTLLFFHRRGAEDAEKKYYSYFLINILLCVLRVSAVNNYFFFGIIIMLIIRPSSFGYCSTSPTSATS